MDQAAADVGSINRGARERVNFYASVPLAGFYTGSPLRRSPPELGTSGCGRTLNRCPHGGGGDHNSPWAKESELIQYATEIKVRAERRCGELLASTEKNRGAAEAGTARGTTRSHDATASAPTLADMGLTKSESSRHLQLAAIPSEHFETAVATAKATAGEGTTAFMSREVKAIAPPARAHSKPQ